MGTAKSGFGIGAACVMAWVAVGCEASTHEFAEGNAGASGNGGKTGTAGSAQHAGETSKAGSKGEGGTAGVGEGGDGGSDTVAGSNAGGSDAGGSDTGGNDAGGADAMGGGGGVQGGTAGGGSGGKPPEECPAFSCCISGKTFDADEASPLNACDVCKPGQSTTAWTAADGKVCAGEQGLSVQPKGTIYRKEACALMCNHTDQTLTAKVQLQLKFSGCCGNVTTNESFILLDFSNLTPGDNVSVSKAILKFYGEPDAPTQETRSITVKRNGTADNICSLTLPTDASLVPLQCDVTAAVQSWLASPAGNERAFKISISAPADRTGSVLTSLTSDGTQRPQLLLDYSAKCDDNTCPKLLQ